MMKIAGDELAIAYHEVASEDVKILGAGVKMSRITRAGFEFAEQYGVAAVAFQREQLDGRARNGQLFPAGFAGGRRKNKTHARGRRSLSRSFGGPHFLNAPQNFA